MQPPRWSIYARIALVAITAGALNGCAPAWHHRAPAPYYAAPALYYDYHYYPAIDAYYDPRVRTYIYLEHNHWVRSRALPVHVRPHMGHYVTVRSGHERPYEEHHRHREQYPRKQYINERDHKRPPGYRDGDRRSEVPRQPLAERTRDDRRTAGNDRDRSRQEARQDRQPRPGSAPRERAADRQSPRQGRNPRPQGDQRDRPGKPTAGTTPASPQNRVTPVRQPGRQPDKARTVAAPRQREQPASGTAPAAQEEGRKRTPRDQDGPDHRAGKADKPPGKERRRDEDHSSARLSQRDRGDRYGDHR